MSHKITSIDMDDNKRSFKELIQRNIDQYGYHITIVGGAIEPRFAYSIGLYSQFPLDKFRSIK